MPNQHRPGTVRIGLTIDAEIRERADQEARRLSAKMGIRLQAADVIRSVLAKHLPPLEGTTLAPATPKPPAKKRKP